MLFLKFKLIPIKIGFFTNFLSCSKIGPKSLYYSTWSWAKFHQKWQGENSSFLYFFLMHIHVLMLFLKYELIPIKIGFLKNFKVAPKSGQSIHCERSGAGLLLLVLMLDSASRRPSLILILELHPAFI